MTKASDVRYGRQGGRIVDVGGTAAEALAAIHRQRIAIMGDRYRPQGAEADQWVWPQESIEMWVPIAAEAHALGDDLDDLHRRALDVEAAARAAGRWPTEEAS